MVTLSNDTVLRIRLMMGNDELGDEVVNRLTCLAVPPRTEENGRAILDSTYSILDDKITQVLRSKMANYDHGECGVEIAKGLTGCLQVLEQHLAGKNPDLYSLMGEKMDKVAFEALILAMSSNHAAKEFRSAYDRMFDSLTNLNLLKPIALSPEYDHVPVEVLVDAKTDRIHEESPIKRVNSKRIKRIRLKKDS